MNRRAVVLFCGGGGSSLGIEQAQIPTIGFDCWAPAVAVHNAAGMVAHMHDISDPTGDDRIPAAALMWASPPCQPFSAAGSRQGSDDKRDGWPWTLRIVAKRRPDVFIAENVQGMTYDGEPAQYLARIVTSLEELGYGVRWRVLNCADYGVPQTRRRLFIVARRDGGPIAWPTPTHCEAGGMFTVPWVTMAEALGWGHVGKPIHTITRGSSSGGGFDLASSSNTPQEMREAVGTDRWAMRPIRGAGAADRHGDRRDVPMTEPAPSITAHPSRQQWVVDRRQGGAPLINDAIKIEPYEAGILQGFPADYPWDAAPSRTSAFKAIGNAVPPIMARLLVEANLPEVWK